MDDTDDLVMLQDSFRQVLQAECPLDRVMAHVDGTDLSDPLSVIVTELGWPALAIPEAFDGAGLDTRALALLYRELGRVLAPAPLMPALIVADAIACFGSEQQKARWLPLLASGRRATLTWPDAAPVQFEVNESGLRICGTAQQLFHANGAELAFVLAASDQGDPAYLLVDPAEDGVKVELLPSIDATRAFGRIVFDNVSLPSDRLLSAVALEDRLRRHGAIAIAADSLGGAETILDMTLEYMRTRHQFDRPIGSFQALKHRCADHKMALVAADALLAAAVERFAGAGAGSIETSAAKQACCEAYVDLAQDAIQLHGGIGFTWEHPCHLFLKRARLNQAAFGTSSWHLDHIAELLSGQN